LLLSKREHLIEEAEVIEAIGLINLQNRGVSFIRKGGDKLERFMKLPINIK
jgi:hypothetical protein